MFNIVIVNFLCGCNSKFVYRTKDPNLVTPDEINNIIIFIEMKMEKDSLDL